ncbi:hydrogenase-1 small chain [Salmonella enterica subsp. enterica]|uniref:Hydrogenase-1 small chain n=1 Tax=Salmonella enterica I TaxID=59201 RepID=A0A3S5DMU2_SALET|nr:hydrogenase-1 small chain [Salmonella enterica subsp. enterica]
MDWNAPAVPNPLSVSSHPLAKDVILSLISLDYDDTLMAAAGRTGRRSL